MEYTAEQLRLVLRDTDSAVFTNEQLELYRSMFPASIYRAASFAVRSWAIEASAAGRSVKTDDLVVDLKSRGADLLKVADSFAADADAEDEAAAADIFMVVPLAGSSRANIRPEGTPWPSPDVPAPTPTPPGPSGGLDGGTP